MTDKHFNKFVVLLALILYTITAYYSIGYYHGDEHYQIIEFSGTKTGTHSPDDLAWEYHERSRSTIQPSLCYFIFNILHSISIHDPYHQVLILRLLTCFLAIFTIHFFVESCTRLILPEYRKPYLVLSYFLWFLPWINVRFSSETWSGLLFLPALALLLKTNKNTNKYFIIGGLLGLSFLFRFQTALLSLGMLLWLIFVKKEKASNLFKLCFSGLMMLFLGVCIDSWFYGQIVISFWNYFYVQIVNDVASSFGTSPWYYYLYYTFRFSFFPFGTVIIIAFFMLLYSTPKSIFLWSVIPFLIVHSIIPHKELRFLFPIINLVPIIGILAYQEYKREINSLRFRFKYLMNVLVVSFVLINIVGLITSSTKPAGIGRMKITQFINRKYGNQPINLIYFDGSNPYDPWNGLHAKFYQEKDIREVRLNSLSELNNSLSRQVGINLLVLKKKQTEKNVCRKILSEMSFKKETQSIPEWMEPIMGLYGGFKNKEILVLYSTK